MAESTSPIEQTFPPSEIATKFAVTVATVRNWIKEGKLKAIVINGRYRVPESELRKFAEDRYGE